jgi:hypothetical protein
MICNNLASSSQAVNDPALARHYATDIGEMEQQAAVMSMPRHRAAREPSDGAEGSRYR